MEEHFKKERKQKIKQFQDRSAKGLTSDRQEEIIPASVDGRVDTLFLQKGKDLYGLYDLLNRKIIPDESTGAYRSSLFNLAAVHTMRNGGRVYLAGTGEMPLKDTEINALIRY